jgi:hypothetical protein
MRRCGAHQVILPDGSILQQAVVEIQEGRVVNYFEFREELPMTEWLGGEIRVERVFHRAYREIIVDTSIE